MKKVLFKVLPQGTAWKSGAYENIASIQINQSDLEGIVGSSLSEGEEDGWGRWVAIAVCLNDGEQIEFIKHFDAPKDIGFIIRADKNVSSNIMEKIKNIFKLKDSDVSWLNESFHQS